MAHKLYKAFQIILIFCFLLSESLQSQLDTLRDRYFKDGPCAVQEFRCLNNKCIKKSLFCNGENDCTDQSDEKFCRTRFQSYYSSQDPCPNHLTKCANDTTDKCIPSKWKCDGIIDCGSGWDETKCGGHRTSFGIERLNAIKWLKEQSKTKGTERWGDDVHRISVAFYLSGADLSSFTTSELAYEVNVQLLKRLAKRKIEDIPSSEIAQYIQALLVTCGNPRSFFSFDLVSELRKQVNALNYTNPFLILALCNAGEAINEYDIEKLTDAFYGNHTEFWSDTQAYAIMALTCAASQSNPTYNLSNITELIMMMTENQQESGIIDNLKTTSLVMQAVYAAKKSGSQDSFNVVTAINRILAHQLQDGSYGNLINTYYTLPVLNYRHLADINTDHCPKDNKEEKKLELSENWFYEAGSKYDVLYSQWIGDEKEIQKTLKLRASTNATIYSLMKIAASGDESFRFKSNIKNGKPFIYSLSDIQDDPESGKYWFFFWLNNTELVPIKNSPADITVENNQHFVYWFRTGAWHTQHVTKRLKV